MCTWNLLLKPAPLQDEALKKRRLSEDNTAIDSTGTKSGELSVAVEIEAEPRTVAVVSDASAVSNSSQQVDQVPSAESDGQCGIDGEARIAAGPNGTGRNGGVVVETQKRSDIDSGDNEWEVGGPSRQASYAGATWPHEDEGSTNRKTQSGLSLEGSASAESLKVPPHLPSSTDPQNVQVKGHYLWRSSESAPSSLRHVPCVWISEDG